MMKLSVASFFACTIGKLLSSVTPRFHSVPDIAACLGDDSLLAAGAQNSKRLEEL